MTLKTRNFSDGAVTVAKMDAVRLTAAKFATITKTGYIRLPLASWRVTAASNYSAVAVDAGQVGSGGVMGADATTAPALIRVNADTDKAARIVFADGSVTPIVNDFTLPADVDATAALTFKVLAAMSGTNNATSILTLAWVAVGPGAYAAGADQGSATSAFAAVTTLVTKSITIAAAAINAPGNHVSVELTPTSPGTDAMHIYATWVEYTRK